MYYTKKNNENCVSRQLYHYQTQKTVKGKWSHILNKLQMQLSELIDYLPIMTRN